ncbi:hypothetical protein ABVK25_007281 [Lepraria finkii]|uniref:Uncharacterized protein n=1 Tax=Lepraria finkii TaxID=1340010 RepID=A0ABR4B3D7_9LECA
MWLVPGLMTMEIENLGFPIHQIHKYACAVRETQLALAEFDQKRLKSYTDSTMTDSILTRSFNSKHGRMFSTESLDGCLATNADNLQVYASCMELNGENIFFLTRVLAFYNSCTHAFNIACKSSADFQRARIAMFRVRLSIFVSLVHSRMASYPINIESRIYSRLDASFGPAIVIIASNKHNRSSSIATTVSNITPWDDEDKQATDTAGDEISYRADFLQIAKTPAYIYAQWVASTLGARIRIMRAERALLQWVRGICGCEGSV